MSASAGRPSRRAAPIRGQFASPNGRRKAVGGRQNLVTRAELEAAPSSNSEQEFYNTSQNINPSNSNSNTEYSNAPAIGVNENPLLGLSNNRQYEYASKWFLAEAKKNPSSVEQQFKQFQTKTGNTKTVPNKYNWSRAPSGWKNANLSHRRRIVDAWRRAGAPNISLWATLKTLATEGRSKASTAAKVLGGAAGGAAAAAALTAYRPDILWNAKGTINGYKNSNYLKLIMHVSRIVGPDVIGDIAKKLRGSNIGPVLTNFTRNLNAYASNTSNKEKKNAFNSSIYRLIASLFGYTNANSPAQVKNLVNIAKKLHTIAMNNSAINSNAQTRLGTNFVKNLRELILKFMKRPGKPSPNGTPGPNRLKPAKNAMTKAAIRNAAFLGAKATSMGNTNANLIRELSNLIYREYQDPRYSGVIGNMMRSLSAGGRATLLGAKLGYPATGRVAGALIAPTPFRLSAAARNILPPNTLTKISAGAKNVARAGARGLVQANISSRQSIAAERNNWLTKFGGPNKKIVTYFNKVKSGANVKQVASNMLQNENFKNRRFTNTGSAFEGPRIFNILTNKEQALINEFIKMKARRSWLNKHDPNRQLNRYFKMVAEGKNARAVAGAMKAGGVFMNKRNWETRGSGLEPGEIQLLNSFQNLKNAPRAPLTQENLYRQQLNAYALM